MSGSSPTVLVRTRAVLGIFLVEAAGRRRWDVDLKKAGSEEEKAGGSGVVVLEGERGDKEGRVGEGALAMRLRRGTTASGGVEARAGRCGEVGGENRDAYGGEDGTVSAMSP